VTTGRVKARRILLYVALVVGAVLSLIPLLWMVSASLMPTGEASTYPPRLFPHTVTFEHYRVLFTRLTVGRSLLNSTIIAVAITGLSLFINGAAGYAFAKIRFRGRNRTFYLLTLGLLIPTQVAMLPLFLMMKEMHLVNTYWGVIIPGLASIFGIFRHHGCSAAGASVAPGSDSEPKPLNRSYRAESRSSTVTRSSFASCATSAVLMDFAVASWSTCAPPAGSGMSASTTPRSSRSGPERRIAFAARSASAGLRHRIDAEPSGEITE